MTIWISVGGGAAAVVVLCCGEDGHVCIVGGCGAKTDL